MLYKNHKHNGTVEQSYTKEVAKKKVWLGSKDTIKCGLYVASMSSVLSALNGQIA